MFSFCLDLRTYLQVLTNSSQCFSKWVEDLHVARKPAAILCSWETGHFYDFLFLSISAVFITMHMLKHAPQGISCITSTHMHALNLLPVKCVPDVCDCCLSADVWLDHAQQRAVSGWIHWDRQQPPSRHGAADPAQPLCHELHGKKISIEFSQTSTKVTTYILFPVMPPQHKPKRTHPFILLTD